MFGVILLTFPSFILAANDITGYNTCLQGGGSSQVCAPRYFSDPAVAGCVINGTDPQVCVSGNTGGPPNQNPANNPPPNNNAPAAPGAGGSLACPTGMNPVNGICLPPNPIGGSGLINSQNLSDFLTQVIKLLLGLAGVIAVLALIVGGFWYITSAGNEEQSEKGKKTLINAIIGVVIILLSYAIVTVIGNTLSQSIK